MYPVARMLKTMWLIALFTFLGAFKGEVVLSQCTINTTPINFGNYDAFSGTPLDAAGFITVNCSRNVVWAHVTLSASSTSGTFNPRRMKRSAGADLLAYNVYSDVTRTAIFGDGTGGTSGVDIKRPPGTPRAWSQTVSLYGRISTGQDVPVGTYSDTLTATVTP
jgi:spore coat protein U-like protein